MFPCKNDDIDVGVFMDCSPDRWGRTLLNRKERLLAIQENRMPKKLLESDYLLGVYDEARMGALRFALEKDGPFVSCDSNLSIPPFAKLRDLEEASRNFEIDENPNNDKWIRQLIEPGSSLGGARPKATIKDIDESLWIAKFPSKNDDIDVGAWEYITHELAVLCCLNVAEAKLQRFSDKGSTYLVKRFDRNNNNRIQFISAMTALGMKDGDGASSGVGYIDLIDFIKTHGSNPNEDIHELFRRIIFSMCIHNIDDHLRNHGFILEEKGYRLSPMYDVNPTPYGEELSLNISLNDNQITKNNIYSLGKTIGYKDEQIKIDIQEISSVVNNNWEKLAKKHVTNSSIEYMRPAFMFAENLKNGD